MSAGYYQKKLGAYDFFEVISSLRKEIKIGRTREAIYWLNVILTYDETAGAKTVAKQLYIMAAEDIYDEQVVLRAAAVYQMIGKISETDHLFYLVARMCEAEKWWSNPSGVMVDYLWASAIGDLKKNPRPIPSFALDRHTARGARALRQGKSIDDKFSGTDEGRQKTAYLYARDGKLEPDQELDDGYYVHWSQYQELLGEQDEPRQQPLMIEDSL